jgi:hypothetical protein
MNSIAHEIAEAVDEKGFKVDLAMEADDCFTSTQARAMLFRDIVTEAAGLAASRVASIDYRPVNGSGRELRGAVGNADRRYRIKRATLVGDELKIRANSDSALASPSDPEDEMLFGHLEQWVLGWSMTIDERIDEVFVAKVLGVTEEKPHWLILGPQVQLLTGPSGPEPQRGFTPTDDGGLHGNPDRLDGRGWAPNPANALGQGPRTRRTGREGGYLRRIDVSHREWSTRVPARGAHPHGPGAGLRTGLSNRDVHAYAADTTMAACLRGRTTKGPGPPPR